MAGSGKHCNDEVMALCSLCSLCALHLLPLCAPSPPPSVLAAPLRYAGGWQVDSGKHYNDSSLQILGRQQNGSLAGGLPLRVW